MSLRHSRYSGMTLFHQQGRLDKPRSKLFTIEISSGGCSCASKKY